MRYYHLPPILVGASIVLMQSQIAVALSGQEVESIGREITVRIVDSQNPVATGSGVIIKQSSNTYTVLTAYHVVKDDSKYEIITPDQQSNQIKSVKHLSGVDLAVVEFSSSKSYKVAKIGNSDKATASTTVYVVGFPGRRGAIPNPTLFFTTGRVNANGTPQGDGYNLIYDNDTLGGMSGGPVLNEQGEVVAIHGRADEQEIGEKSQSKIITGLGITINSALQKISVVGVDLGVRPPNVVATGPKADDFFIQAKQKDRNQDYKGAIADYTQAIRLNPKYAQAYYQRGIVQLNLYDRENAAKDLQTATKLFLEQGNQVEGYNSQAVARTILKDYQGAIAAYTQSIKLNPEDAQAYNKRGNAYSDLGEKQKAIADYNQAIKIDPYFDDAYNNRGIVRQEQGDTNGALADYNQVIKINPNYAHAYNNRGLIRQEQGDKQAALADYNQAIKINPNLAEAYSNRGIIRQDAGDQQGALADFNSALKLNPNYAEAYYNRGRLRYLSGDKEGALADNNQAIKINPNFPKAYLNRGTVRDDLGDNQGALADYNQALKINPNDPEVYNNRGAVRLKLGDTQGALADYDQAIKINPNYAAAYFNRGVLRSQMQDLQGALADYNQALKINPNLAQIYGSRGLLRLQLGDKQGAIADLQKAAEWFRQQGNTQLYQTTLDVIKKLQQ
ncbi:tetratricopeptide repeat-containing serine protease family protein [Pelatocladus sp. BLCC-F211]|uniref:tetratricopeptide repeat-containing serine protease family protein n=1 Tax=Pelatocladus sp. BLCC-F211 TaxID=3342752 RepID=UPI0035BAAD9B